MGLIMGTAIRVTILYLYIRSSLFLDLFSTKLNIISSYKIYCSNIAAKYNMSNLITGGVFHTRAKLKQSL